MLHRPQSASRRLHKTAKEIDGKFAPNAAIANAVEHALSDEFEQRMGSSEVEKSIRLACGDELSATLDQTRTIVAEERT